MPVHYSNERLFEAPQLQLSDLNVAPVDTVHTLFILGSKCLKPFKDDTKENKMDGWNARMPDRWMDGWMDGWTDG